MKYLVLGSGGMLGHAVCVYLREQGHDVSDMSFPGKPFHSSIIMDVFDLSVLDKHLNERCYDIIINCIALLQKESALAQGMAVYINSYFPHWLESRTSHMDTKVIQVSTDGVYGNDIIDRTENSPHTGLSFYARSKSLGELNNAKDLTVRSSFFGPDRNQDGRGLLNWFFSSSGEINGYTQSVFSGVTSIEFARFCAELKPEWAGSYNLKAPVPISKGALLAMVKELFNIENISIHLKGDVVQNTAIQSVRDDIGFISKGYSDMLAELKEFMLRNKEHYPHYTFLD